MGLSFADIKRWGLYRTSKQKQQALDAMVSEYGNGTLVQDIAGTADQIVLDDTTTPGVLQIRAAPNLATSTIRAKPVPRTAVPTVTPGTGAGTGPTVVDVAGDDDEVYIEITTGSSPVSSATIFELNWTSAYAQTPIVTVVPVNQTAWGWQNAQAKAVYFDKATSTGSKAVVRVGTTALSAATTYSWVVRTRARTAP